MRHDDGRLGANQEPPQKCRKIAFWLAFFAVLILAIFPQVWMYVILLILYLRSLFSLA
jgi:hypothetical protein